MGSHPNRRPHGFGNRWVQAPDRVAPETDLGAHRAACLEQVAFQTLISRERVLPKKKSSSRRSRKCGKAIGLRL
jgi:hypothetical protein